MKRQGREGVCQGGKEGVIMVVVALEGVIRGSEKGIGREVAWGLRCVRRGR